MYSISDLKKEVLITLDGVPYRVVDSQHVSLGRGGAVMRTKLKNLLTGNVLERTFRASEKIEAADIERRTMQFLYRQGKQMTFMNQQTFDQETIEADNLGDQAAWLPEGSEVGLLNYQGKIIGADLPNNVFLKVTKAEPGARGNTATAALKPAEVETGQQVMVPMFISEGDVIKVDTRSGQYLERQK